MHLDAMLPIRTVNRRRLDQRLAGLGDRIGPRPPQGWIRTVREVLGMSHYVVGKRAGVNASNVRQLERAEEEGRIQLRSLERIADALNCRLCYVLVPKEPLEQMARRQALDKATRAIAARPPQADFAGRDPALLAEAVAVEVESLANELVNRRDLWDTERAGGPPTRSEPS